MSLLGKALAKDRAQSDSAEEVTVKEWGEHGPFFSTPITLADNARVDKMCGDDAGSSRRMAFTIIAKLTDGEGEPVFDVGDIGEIMNQPADRIMNLYLAILKVGEKDESVEDHIKN